MIADPLTAPPFLPLCVNPDHEDHPDGCVSVVDYDELAACAEAAAEVKLWMNSEGAELVDFVRRLGPMLEQLERLAPILARVGGGGPAGAVFGFLAGRPER
jgi:hypothetical protein